MQIIFINRYFHPDYSATSQILSDLVFALAERGKRISVITSRQLYDAPQIQLPGYEIVSNVAVHRVWTSRFGRHSLFGRAIDYLTFYLSAAWRLWRLARQGDIIVAKTDPPILSVVIAPIARTRRAKLVNWLQDLFPEVLEALDLDGKTLRRAAYNFMRTLRNRSLRQAQMNIVIGERMAERLARFDVPPERIRIVPNWADGSLVTPRPRAANSLRRDWSLEDKFVVGYSGNLGRAHEIDTMVEAIAHLERDGNRVSAIRDVVWLFIGGGALYQRLQVEVEARGLTSVQFRPYQPREYLAESLSVPDVHLVSLRPELEGLVVPSKYYGIAAAGRPAIFVGGSDGEIARILQAHKCGETIAPGDGVGLAALIRSLAANPKLAHEMGRRGRSAFEFGFDVPLAVLAWEKILAALQNDMTEMACDAIDPPAGMARNMQVTKHHIQSNNRHRGNR